MNASEDQTEPIRQIHEREVTLCINCSEPHPCATIRAIEERGL